MKIIGYRRSDFMTTEGVEIKGYTVIMAREINAKIGNGCETENMYFSCQKLKNAGYEMDDLLHQDVKISYNRYGKMDSFTVLEA